MKKLITHLTLALAATLLMVPRAQAQTEVPASQGLLAPAGATLRSVSELRGGELKPLKNSVYVATDITGKKYDIDAILKSGKAIMIDFSAVWCGPCWSLHKSGVLEKLYAKFGPEGTKQIEVFWVGADPQSTVDKINGKGGGTKGDWTKVDGKPVPYPIFSDAQMIDKLGIPVGGFPTLVLVGPGNKWVECRGEVQTDDVNFTKFAKLLTLFMTDADKPGAVSISGPTDLYAGETHSFKLAYSTVAPVTKVEWTAPEGITLQKVSDTEYKVSVQTKGSYELTAAVTNKNGTTKGTLTLTVSDPISTFPFVAKMDTKDKLDKGWRSLDHDGDGFGFDSFTGKGLVERLGLYLKDNAKIGAEYSEDALVSWGNFLPTKFENGGRYNGTRISPNNELLSAPLVIPADAAKPTFSCYIMSYFTDDKEDQLKVMVSELGGQPVQVLAPQSGGADWKLIQADLSAYKGKTILLSLIPVVNGGSGILVDQLRVTMDGTTDVTTPTLSLQTVLYPNPATDFITVRTAVGSTIELFTIEGSIVYSSETVSETTTVTVAQLPAGRYIARITAADGETVLRPVIIR